MLKPQPELPAFVALAAATVMLTAFAYVNPPPWAAPMATMFGAVFVLLIGVARYIASRR